jgi:distribution and morphology protein 31
MLRPQKVLDFPLQRYLSSLRIPPKPRRSIHTFDPKWEAKELSTQPSKLQHLAFTAWRRCAHTKSKRRRFAAERRNKSSVSEAPKAKKNAASAPKAELSPKSKSEISSSKKAIPAAPAGKSILDNLPHLPHLHRPTKDELLAAATGAWSRFKIHFKWFSIKSTRPFNMDDISAFFSWILVGHVVWILVGTTTFFSLLVLVVNTVFAQGKVTFNPFFLSYTHLNLETLARWIGNYLTQSSGIQVIFESAVVPKWKDGVISFQNVFVSRRPGRGKAKVIKGSQSEAAAAAAAAATGERLEAGEDEDDGNYTQFDVSMDTVNVTLSFAKWFNGKGLLRDVEIKGVRGVVDRAHVVAPFEYVDPRTYKHEHAPGDFELDSFKMEDLLVTIYQPNGFRPFSVSIFSCDLPQLRKQWLFYDFMSASMMSGSFDNSLFTIHPRQTHNYTGTQLAHGVEIDGDPSQWKKHTRFRIDSLNIDHLNRGVEGPFSWIQQGNVDIVADIMFPADGDDSIAKVMSDFYDRMEATVTSTPRPQHGGQLNAFNHDHEESEPEEAILPSDEDNRFMIMDLRVSLNDVRATVPLFTKDISYVNNALIRPIVAYINSKNAFIPVNCRVVKRIIDFDGSWTIFDSGLMDDLSREVSRLLLLLRIIHQVDHFCFTYFLLLVRSHFFFNSLVTSFTTYLRH